MRKCHICLLDVTRRLLVQASLKIDAAVGLLAKYDGANTLLSIAKELYEKSEMLLFTMQRKHDKSLKK